MYSVHCLSHHTARTTSLSYQHLNKPRLSMVAGTVIKHETDLDSQATKPHKEHNNILREKN